MRKSSAASRDFTLVVMTESSTYSPVLSWVRVAAQAANVAISIRRIKQYELNRYPYSGHSVLMGKIKHDWQDTQGGLEMFSRNKVSSRRLYEGFVEKGMDLGKRPDLTGGGLIRSTGGWEVVKVLKKEKVFQRNDERILGDGDFVDRILASAEEVMERRHALKALGFDLGKVASRVSEVLGVKKRPFGVREGIGLLSRPGVSSGSGP